MSILFIVTVCFTAPLRRSEESQTCAHKGYLWHNSVEKNVCDTFILI